MPNNNILYISYDGMTDPLGQSQVIPYLSGLSANGYNVTILSCEKPNRFFTYKNKIQTLLSQANIIWETILYTKSPPVLSTLYDHNKLVSRAKALHKKNNFALLHCRSYISALVGLRIKKAYNVPFVFDMRGFWADERVDGGLWDLKNVVFNTVYKFFKKKEQQFLNNSDAVISLTYTAKNEILTWQNLDLNADKIEVIPCCVDTDLFNPQHISGNQQIALREKLQIDQHDLVLGYLGSIGTWYLLDEMMQFFALTKKEHPHAKFLFVTADSQKDIIETAKKYNIDRSSIIITEAQRNEVNLYISIFTYGIFFIKPSYSKKASSPTKQGEIMAMGIPVICNYGVGDTDHLVEKYNSGVVVKLNAIENYPIKSLFARTFDKQEIRNGALQYFSLKKGVELYEGVYRKILTKQV